MYRRIVQAKLFIDANYSENIDLQNVSSEAAFSKFHFLRLFKDIYGLTPYLYLKQVRIEKAKEFLAENIPVNEVCYRIGFESVTSFTSLFKRTVGVTPSTYQQDRQTRLLHIKKAPLKFVPSCFAASNGWIKKQF